VRGFNTDTDTDTDTYSLTSTYSIVVFAYQRVMVKGWLSSDGGGGVIT
jgi:hypothetical protein